MADHARVRVALVVLTLVAGASAGMRGQSGPPPQPPVQPPAEPARGQEPIRSGAELVRVDVTVVDGRGRPVTDLTADDFEVREDGVPQAIRQFRLVEVDGHPDEGDETSLVIRSVEHAAAEAAREDVRVFLIFWDEYHINHMSGARSGREHLLEFVRTAFGPTDLVALMDPLTPVSALRFTRDRYALADAVRRLQGRSGIYVPARSVVEEAHLQSRENPERLRSQVTLTALKSAVVHLSTLRQGRKSIILISEGMRGLGRDGPSMLLDLINTANDSNTGIYVVNPLGLTMARQRSFDMLRSLADNTGGEAFATNDLGAAFRRVVTQASAYYLIGYSPSETPLDGRFHKIQVRVKRPGVDVRARAGYWAPTLADMRRAELRRLANRLPPAIEGALAQLTPSTARRSMDVWVGTGLNADGRPEVRLAWTPRADEFDFDTPPIAGVTAVATGEAGEAYSGGVDADGLRFRALPGRLHISLEAHDARGDVVDRLERTIDVPDPARADLWISSPLVIRTSTPLELRAARLDPTPSPAAGRQFSRSDRLLIRFAIHGRDAGPAVVTARLLNQRAAPLTDLPLSRNGNHYELDLQLTQIARGDFVIGIEARHGDQHAASYVPLRVIR